MTDFRALGLALGAAGSVLPVPVPELPGPISADSREHPDVERNPLGVATPAYEEAHASAEPAARARARGPELALPGVVVSTGESRAEANTTATAASVTLGRLALGGGTGGAPPVVLSNLVWSARQELGHPEVGSFSIGSVTVAGQTVPFLGADGGGVPAGSAETLTTLNDTLAPAGLHLDTPVVNGDAAGAMVSALVVSVRNPETTAGVLRGAVGPATPTLNSMLDTLLAAAPDAAASRLVVNALVATATTQGGGRVELGGGFGRWSFSPTDYTASDDAREIYWDRNALSSFNNKPGRYVTLNGGRRYRGSSWPDEAPPAPIPPAAAP